MKYKCIKLENMDLYFINTNKFKSIDIKLFFYKEVVKEEMTWRNCLVDVLLYATKKFPSKKALAIKKSELYSLLLGTSNMRFGNYYMTKIGISLLNPKYTEAKMLDESLDILSDIVFDPLVENDAFNKEYLSFIKAEQKADTETIKENSRVYSDIQLANSMEKEMPYTFNGYSDLEILNNINEYNLYDYYKKFLNDNKVFAVVVGEVDEQKIINYFKDNFSFKPYNFSKPIVIEHQNVLKEPRLVIEEGDYQQSKLAISFKIKDLTSFEYYYVLSIYNSILGGGTDNKLMKIIREQNSLAYYVKSSVSKADNLMYINSGIDSKNYEKTVSLIRQVMNDMANGNFSEKDISKSKMEYITIFDEALETSSGHTEILLGQILFDTPSIEERKKEIMKVTKEDIMKIAQKIHIDTIFLLKGV